MIRLRTFFIDCLDVEVCKDQDVFVLAGEVEEEDLFI